MNKTGRNSFFIVVFMLAFSAHADGLNIVRLVQWKGVGVPVALPEGLGGEAVPAGTPCYKVPMLLPNTAIRIGTGFDCLTNPGSLAGTGEGTVTTNYIFSFQGLGSIVSKNRVVIRSAADDDVLNPPGVEEQSVNKHITHILGSFPEGDNIVGGTHRFSEIEGGHVRVSGAVSLANFPQELVFDSLYVIEASSSSEDDDQ